MRGKPSTFTDASLREEAFPLTLALSPEYRGEGTRSATLVLPQIIAALYALFGELSHFARDIRACSYHNKQVSTRHLLYLPCEDFDSWLLLPQLRHDVTFSSPRPLQR